MPFDSFTLQILVASLREATPGPASSLPPNLLPWGRLWRARSGAFGAGWAEMVVVVLNNESCLARPCTTV